MNAFAILRTKLQLRFGILACLASSFAAPAHAFTNLDLQKLAQPISTYYRVQAFQNRGTDWLEVKKCQMSFLPNQNGTFFQKENCERPGYAKKDQIVAAQIINRRIAAGITSLGVIGGVASVGAITAGTAVISAEWAELDAAAIGRVWGPAKEYDAARPIRQAGQAVIVSGIALVVSSVVAVIDTSLVSVFKLAFPTDYSNLAALQQNLIDISITGKAMSLAPEEEGLFQSLKLQNQALADRGVELSAVEQADVDAINR